MVAKVSFWTSVKFDDMVVAKVEEHYILLL